MPHKSITPSRLRQNDITYPGDAVTLLASELVEPSLVGSRGAGVGLEGVLGRVGWGRESS